MYFILIDKRSKGKLFSHFNERKNGGVEQQLSNWVDCCKFESDGWMWISKRNKFAQFLLILKEQKKVMRSGLS